MKNNLDAPVAKQCRPLYTKMSKYTVTSYTDIHVPIKNGPQAETVGMDQGLFRLIPMLPKDCMCIWLVSWPSTLSTTITNTRMNYLDPGSTMSHAAQSELLDDQYIL